MAVGEAPFDGWQTWKREWEPRIADRAAQAMLAADAGHGLDHVRRVVVNAVRIGKEEQADPCIVLPAAWLHDCVHVPKDSPDRNRASRLAASLAYRILSELDYPESYRAAIVHAIEAHSFSANIACESIEAQVVQDADRLEALGSIGIARCLLTAGSLGQALYSSEEPFPIDRSPDDRLYSIDHFFAKLFKLPHTMKTGTGRAEAMARIAIMTEFLKQLARELSLAADIVDRSLDRLARAPKP